MKMKMEKFKVKLEGISDIMFDKFFDHSKEVRPPEQKMYLAAGNKVVFPSENIHAFLWGEKPGGCAKTNEGKKAKDYIRTGQSHVFIDPIVIPFSDGKKDVVFEEFGKGNLWVHEASPTTKGAGGAIIKQELKKRPVLRAPWYLEFQITIIENSLIDEQKLYNWFCNGGILIALGTYRPRFGRFQIDTWNKMKSGK